MDTNLPTTAQVSMMAMVSFEKSLHLSEIIRNFAAENHERAFTW